MSKEEQEFINQINGVNKQEKKRFGGTGGGIANPGKQSFTQVWADNYKEYVPGEFGKKLAEQVKLQNKNDLTKSKEQIINELKKEGII